MKIVSRITLIMTAVAGIVFVILGICFMGMAGYMNSVVASSASNASSAVEVIEEAAEETSGIIIEEAKAAPPNFTSGGVAAMLALGLVFLLYGGACAIVSILSIKKLEKAKAKKDIKVYGIFASIFSFVAPGVFLLRLTDDEIREKEEIEDRRR